MTLDSVAAPLVGQVMLDLTKDLDYEAVGGIIWTQSVIFLGYILGERLKGSVDTYILPIVGLIIVISLIPVLLEIIKEWRTKRHLS